MITDLPKLTTKIALYGILVSIFTIRIHSESPEMYAAYKKGTYPNFRQRPIFDIA